MHRDRDRCYRVIQSRDPRFDGMFLTAVRTTGIYCRPSCPARTPRPQNVEFFPSAAAAQLAGYRACKRCRPDVSPGSPVWNARSDVVARAMRLIADGVVDREGVRGVARRLGYSERHLDRLLVAELGAGPLALARSQRSQHARLLIERTSLPMVDVAFAAGFGSLRQFNDTIREVFDATPTELRRLARRGEDVPATVSTIEVRLAVREPFAGAELSKFLARRSLARCETVVEAGTASPRYRRSLDLPNGHGLVELESGRGAVIARFRLADLRDLAAAVARCRRLLDLDADPVAVDGLLSDDPALAPLVSRRPGLRSPGAVDGFEMLVRAVLGQQVSLVAGVRLVEWLVAAAGEPLALADEQLDRVFPAPEAVAALDPASIPVPARRAHALIAAADAVASGRVELGPAADRGASIAALRDIDGIGPWTTDYLALRAFGDPDVMLAGDLVVRRRAEQLGLLEPGGTAARLVDISRRWSPWRTTVVHHLWAAGPDDLGELP